MSTPRAIDLLLCVIKRQAIQFSNNANRHRYRRDFFALCQNVLKRAPFTNNDSNCSSNGETRAFG